MSNSTNTKPAVVLPAGYTEFSSVPATASVDEYEGIIEKTGKFPKPGRDGKGNYDQGFVLFKDGPVVEVPLSDAEGGNFKWRMELKAGVQLAVRAFYVPVLDRETGVLSKKKHYVYGETLAELPTEEEYLDEAYPGKPPVTFAGGLRPIIEL